MPRDDATLSAAAAGSVRPFAWVVCNPVGTYYRSFGYHREALECCLQKTRETGDCFYVRALHAAPPPVAENSTTLTLTDAEREAILEAAGCYVAECDELQAAGVVVESKRLAVTDTLRGLLERHFPVPENLPTQDNTPPAHSNQSEVSVRPECATAPGWRARPFWVDPPSGWQYGFPRLYDPAKDGDMTEWLVANGYPQHLADQHLPCTFTACTDSQ